MELGAQDYADRKKDISQFLSQDVFFSSTNLYFPFPLFSFLICFSKYFYSINSIHGLIYLLFCLIGRSDLPR